MAHDPIRLGIIGLGHMGRRHAANLLKGIEGIELAGVCTSHPEWLQERAPEIPVYASEPALLADERFDAILVCTPHKQHVETALAALKGGKHVLLEKPAAASYLEAQRLAEQVGQGRLVAGVVQNQRMNPVYRQVKACLEQGDLGRIQRVHWTMTAWYRSQAYYDSAPWRGTWSGEGGGVLLNQCSHHLDIMHWLFGTPVSVRAHCVMGKYHDIEVEDEASLLLTYAAGQSATFVASTGEKLGINRLEIVGDLGVLCADDQQVVLRRVVLPDDAERSLQSSDAFQYSEEALPIELQSGDACCMAVIEAFVRAIKGQASELVSIAEAAEPLQLINAAIVSSETAKTIELPLDAGAFAEVYRALQKGRTEVT